MTNRYRVELTAAELRAIAVVASRLGDDAAARRALDKLRAGPNQPAPGFFPPSSAPRVHR
jgi:hypothetical protein